MAAFPVSAATPSAPLSATFIHGSTVYAPSDLFVTYRDQLGLPASRENVRAIAAAIVGMYRRDGYSAPQLRLDDKLAAQGILRIDVLEPKVTRVTIAGDPGPHRESLEQLAAGLANAQPIRGRDIRQVLGRMRQLPGLSVTAHTRRDESHGNGYELALDTKYASTGGMLRIGNRATDAVGPYFVSGRLVANGRLGRSERIGLQFASATDSDEYLGGGGFVDALLTGDGTRATLTGFRSESKPTETPSDLDVRFVRERLTLDVTHPLSLSSGASLSISGTIEFDDFNIDLPERNLREDQLRIAELGARLDWRTTSAQYLGLLELRQGLDALGAGLRTPGNPHDPRRHDFFAMRLQLARLAHLSERWSLRVDAMGQHSSYVLPYSERFKVGSERLGRGFEIAEIAGDSGAGAKLELRRGLPSMPHVPGSASLYGYYDFGAVWRQDHRGRESASTAGFGFAIRGRRLEGYMELAIPLTYPATGGEEGTSIFAELSLPF